MAKDADGRGIFESKDPALMVYLITHLDHWRGIGKPRTINVYELNRQNAEVIADYFRHKGEPVPDDITHYIDHMVEYKPHDILD